MFSFTSIITVALALTTVTLGSPAVAPTPKASVAPIAKVDVIKPLTAAQVTALGDINFNGVEPSKVVPYGKDGVIAYYNTPEGSEAAASKETDTPALQSRACGDNTAGGCDFYNNLARDALCGSLLTWLTGNNDAATVAFCYVGTSDNRCCTSWRGGYTVPGWALVDGVKAIRKRCSSSGSVSGWIDSARLNNQCTTQCLSNDNDACF